MKGLKLAVLWGLLSCSAFFTACDSSTNNVVSPRTDTDGDGVANTSDNCPTVANPEQTDSDQNGVGDACEIDTDNDGVSDGSDNCPALSNANQSDQDGNGIGDACEPPKPTDTDGDGEPDTSDNCPAVANPDQTDADQNGVGDVCDVDTDGDGVADVNDNCPTQANPDQADSDTDGIGDVCDIAATDPPTIEVLSNRADLISGGNVLVEISPPPGVPAGALVVSLNGADISNSLAVTATGKLRGLVQGLELGANILTAGLNGASSSASIVNHPQGGPVFAGPQLQPWTCRNAAAVDDQCNQPPVFTWFYLAEGDDALKSYDPVNPATDVATITTETGETVPFIVRHETGYQDRDQYRIAVLYQPGKEWSANAPQPQFNGKLMITHGSSCGVDYETGGAPNVIAYNPLDFAGLDDPVTPYITEDSAVYALGRGFAVMSTALNNSGHNCDLPLQAESMVMAKEHLIEQYGALRYTIGAGCSGGSLAAQWVANAYPGIYQGILPTCSFPDAWSTATQFVDYHGLLLYFFGDLIFSEEYKQYAPPDWQAQFDPGDYPFQPQEERTAEGWTLQSIADVMGHASVVNAHVSEQAQFSVAVPDDKSGCGGVSDAQLYNAETNPDGVRCSIVEASVNVFDRRAAADWIAPETVIGRGFAGFPLDNVGVQYGLKALQQGKITAKQFIDLNRDIGGLDIDTNHTAARTPASQPALKNAYRSGMINVGNNLNRTAVIDCRGPDPGLFHDAYRAFAMRERLDEQHGNHDNQVIWGGPIPIIGDASCSLNSFKVMDEWLSAVEADDTALPLPQKLTANKPSAAVDSCWDGAGQNSVPVLCPEQVLTVFGTPRMVAGDSIATYTNKCQLKPVTAADYSPGGAGIGTLLIPGQIEEIQAIFPSGTCDYTLPGVSQQGTIPWQRYANDVGAVIYGGEAMADSPENSGTGWMSVNFGGF